jgi:hypothetical protein
MTLARAKQIIKNRLRILFTAKKESDSYRNTPIFQRAKSSQRFMKKASGENPAKKTINIFLAVARMKIPLSPLMSKP